MTKQTRRVVVIDDDPNNASLLAYRLRGTYEVTTLCDSHAHTRGIRKVGPDAIIMDIHLNNADGLLVLQTITGMMPHLKVIVLAAPKSKSEAQACLDRGAMVYMTKPFSPRELVAELDRLLNPERA